MTTTKKFINFITGLSAIALFFLAFTLAYAARVDKVYPANVPGAEFVGTETCAMCHQKQAIDFKKSIHGHFAIKEKNPAGEGCESCHGAGSKHVDAAGEGKIDFIINPRKNPQMCFNCHLEKKAQFNLQYHHPVIEGKVSCSDCHSVHGEDALPGSTTSLDEHNDVCFKCHPEKKGPYVFEHSAMREGCETCHQVHGSVNDKMLQAKDNNLCLKCHYEQNYNFVNAANNAGMYFGKWPHWHNATANLPDATAYGKMTCVSCHVDVHGSNFHPRLIQANIRMTGCGCHP